MTGDQVYGCSKVRLALECRRVGYVLGCERTEPVWALTRQGPAQLPACELLADLPPGPWQPYSAGDGAKGPRIYQWARLGLWRLGADRPCHWLLIRRHPATGQLAFSVCYHPDPNTSLEELVRVAGWRWKIEECFQLAKGETGMDGYQVRTWEGWHRHITLSMLALALLAAARAKPEKGHRPRTRTLAHRRALSSSLSTGLGLHAVAVGRRGAGGQDSGGCLPGSSPSPRVSSSSRRRRPSPRSIDWQQEPSASASTRPCTTA